MLSRFIPKMHKLFNGAFIVLSLGLAVAALAYALPQPWWLELFTHFIMQYAVGAVVFLLYYLLKKKRAQALLSATYLVGTLLVLAPYLHGQSPDSNTTLSTQKVTAIFSNTHYSSVSVLDLAELIQQQQPEFVFLAELGAGQFAELRELVPEYSGLLTEGGRDPWAHPVSYLAPTSVGEIGKTVLYFDTLSPAIEVVAPKYPDLRLLAVHIFPPRSARTVGLRDTALKNIAQHASKQENLVVLGDLNITNFSPPFARMLREGGLSDVRVGRGVLSSWPTVLPTLFGIPIDHALAKGAWQICEFERGPNIGSDHFPLIVTLCYNTIEEM